MQRKILLIIIFVSFSFSAFGDHLISSENALKKIYPQATNFEENYINLNEDQIQRIENDVGIIFSAGHSHRVIMYKAWENDVLAGYAFEDTVIGKWGPIHYLVGLDKDGTILKNIVLDYDEIRGKPIAKRRFLKQYKGKNINNPLKLRKDIDGITGATISSRSLTNGVRKIIHIHSIVNQNQ